MERLRPVKYIVRVEVASELEGIDTEWKETQGRGDYHGLVRGVKLLDKERVHHAYDYALVEDKETGQLLKVEPTDVAFTDVLSVRALDELIRQRNELK